MIKILLILAVMFVSVFIGAYIKNYLSTRNEIYIDFKNLLQLVKLEISFLKTDKNILLKKYDFKNKYLKESIDEYLNSGEMSCKNLNKVENEKLKGILNSIGKNDVEGELKSLEYYESVVDLNCINSKELLDKYGNFSIKLSIIFGALLVIILI